jgi:hypothetical protein
VLNVKCSAFLCDFNPICIISTRLNKSLQCQISRKSVRWKPNWYMWTDGGIVRHDEANRRFSQVCERALECDYPLSHRGPNRQQTILNSRFSPASYHGGPGSIPGSVHVGFVVDKVALGHVFPRVLRFFPVNFIPPVLHYKEKGKN